MYFGSVKFFKHIIVTVFVVAFLLPYVFVIIFSTKYTDISKQLIKTEAAFTSFSETVPKEITVAVGKQIDDSIKAHTKEMNSIFTSQYDKLNEQLDASITDKIYYLDKSTYYQLEELQEKINYTIGCQVAALQLQLNELSTQQVSSKAVKGP